MAVGHVHTSTQVRNRFGQFRRELDAAQVAAVRATVPEATRTARREAPYATGELRRKTQARAAGKQLRIESRAEHSAAIERGARPHLIPGAFGREGAVHHPGNRATRFLLRSLRLVAPKFERRLEEHLRRLRG